MDVPKQACTDDIYRAIFHDPSMYLDPDVFKPERFFSRDGSSREDPVLASAFGYRRRICPGRYFGDVTLFITAASLFSVFNIRRREDKPFTHSYTGSLLRCNFIFVLQQRTAILSHVCSRPNPFPCSVIPRDKGAEELILANSMTS
jgi:Cytochrome P450